MERLESAVDMRAARNEELSLDPIADSSMLFRVIGMYLFSMVACG
jgi:hypothetical protein